MKSAFYMNFNYIIFFSFILFLHIIKAQTDNTPFDYTESDWPSLCKSGSNNSPINFPALNSYSNYVNTTDYMQIVSTNYSEIVDSKFNWISNQKFGINLEGNIGNLILKKKETLYSYNLVELVIKFKSEHTLNGIAGDCELQLVHKKDKSYLSTSNTIDDDSLIDYLILSIIFKAEGDVANNLISQINITEPYSLSALDLNQLYIRKFQDSNFFFYSGGLTYPGCDETVNWAVLENIQKMTITQYTVIKNLLSIKYPNGNSRKVRPLNNRTVYYINKNVDDFLFFAIIIFLFYFILVYLIMKKYFI